MKNETYNLIIPHSLGRNPTPQEISAARILLTHFCADIIFLDENEAHKNPDFLIAGEYWELKSPTGVGKYIIYSIYFILQSVSRIILSLTLASQKYT